MSCPQPQAHPARCGCEELSEKDELSVAVALGVALEMEKHKTRMDAAVEHWNHFERRAAQLEKALDLTLGENKLLKKDIRDMQLVHKNEYWRWQGGDQNSLETLCVPVLISPSDLSKIVEDSYKARFFIENGGYLEIWGKKWTDEHIKEPLCDYLERRMNERWEMEKAFWFKQRGIVI